MQRLFAQQIVRQDYDWQRENSEKESLWNNAMLIELEDFFFTSSWKKLLAWTVETEKYSFL